MPAPVELLGRVFGQLTVIERLEKLDNGFRWRCRCTCGATEDIPQRRLPYNDTNRARRDAAYACASCRQTRFCAHCGKSFQAKAARACCSEACYREYSRQQWRTEYYRRRDADTEFNRKRAAAERARCDADPEYAAAFRERSRRSKIESLARLRALGRNEYLTLMRPKWREYANRYRAKLREDPDRHEEYLEYMRHAGRLSYRKLSNDPDRYSTHRQKQQEQSRRRALAKLLQIGQKLEKLNKDNDDE
ncbi:hypothetical protein [Chromobacterium phragmitis]|uniref:hypothetical protein n=1 Tax=Chromobacterium phragmitis TaxID=2202141 RepID=UPI0011AE53C3|nr:hypothetical protein [Chromobacterium phragmitis]